MLDNIVFRCGGDYIFKDGDCVVLNAISTKKDSIKLQIVKMLQEDSLKIIFHLLYTNYLFLFSLAL